MRVRPLMLAFLLGGCGYVEGEREAAADAARDSTLLDVERAVAEAVRRTEALAGSAERILDPRPVMAPWEVDALRRFPNASHVARASAVGVRVADSTEAANLLAEGRLVALADSAEGWIVRPGTSPALVVPELEALLEELGRRFHGRLAELDVPPYRIEVTSALRSTERQERLRRSNSNAARGVSAHEFGTTLDLSYAAFAPPADLPADVLADVPPGLVTYVDRYMKLAFESVSARKSRELGAIFSQVLLEAQEEGLVLVTYERQQTVYHITVGSRLVDD